MLDSQFFLSIDQKFNRFLQEDSSSQAKECCSRALAQMLIEESIRGLAIQNGLIKICVPLIKNELIAKKTRIQLAHAIAKSLVTTNPNLLTEHLRVSCFSALLFLCK